MGVGQVFILLGSGVQVGSDKMLRVNRGTGSKGSVCPGTWTRPQKEGPRWPWHGAVKSGRLTRSRPSAWETPDGAGFMGPTHGSASFRRQKPSQTSFMEESPGRGAWG